MNFKPIKWACLIGLGMVLFACNDDEDSVDTGEVVLAFDNVVADQDLVLNTEVYTNESGEAYKVRELKYIVSNVVFTKKDGSTFEITGDNRYHLINEDDRTSLNYSLSNIPIGEYVSMKIGFGVEQSQWPLKDKADFIPKAEAAGMIWNWTAGYKFLKFEGAFTAEIEGETVDKDFVIHVGSHGIKLDNYKEIILDIPDTKVETNERITLAVIMDVAKVFDATNTMSLATKSDIQVDPENAPLIAENITTAFSIK